MIFSKISNTLELLSILCKDNTLNMTVQYVIARLLNTIMQSSLPLRLFEHSVGPMMLCTCEHMLVVLCCTAKIYIKQLLNEVE